MFITAKTFQQTLIRVLILGMGTLSCFSTYASETNSELTKINLKVCNIENSRCLTMTANKSIGSSLAPIHSLEKISLALVDIKTNKEMTYSSERGYLDFTYNRIVLTSFLKSRVKETIFDFNDLAPKLTVMK